MIYINEIPSFRNPDSGGNIQVDDRKEKIELINGTAIQNSGIFFGSIPLTCVFSRANFEKLKALWIANEKVSYTDKVGVTFSDLTLKINSYGYVDKFERYISVEMELWKEEY